MSPSTAMRDPGVENEDRTESDAAMLSGLAL